jgi:hypothetical protein
MQSGPAGVVLQDADINRMQSCSVEHGVALYDGDMESSSKEFRLTQ